MSESKPYVAQLAELYESYKGKELEEVLGVTTRSIQNYLKEENPSTPGKEVIAAIREVFAKHSAGIPIGQLKPNDSDDDYKEKYFGLLKDYNANSNELKEMVLAMAKIQRAEMEIILGLAMQTVAGRNKSAEILKRYELADIFQNWNK